MNAQARQLEQDDIPVGAHLVTGRRGYAHHGLYAGNGKVIHYAGFCTSMRRGPVEEVSLERFAAGHAVTIQPEPCARYAGPEAVRRARSRLGENDYRLLRNNCEHLVSWALSGRARSEQVEACLREPALAARAIASLSRAFLAKQWKGLQHAMRPVLQQALQFA